MYGDGIVIERRQLLRPVRFRKMRSRRVTCKVLLCTAQLFRPVE